MAIEAGVSVPQIAKWVGNSSEIIMNHYAGTLVLNWLQWFIGSSLTIFLILFLLQIKKFTNNVNFNKYFYKPQFYYFSTLISLVKIIIYTLLYYTCFLFLEN